MPRKKQRGRRFKRTREEWEAMKKENPALAQKQAQYKLAEKTNASFERYYEGIGIVPEDQWKDFLSVMKKPLPTTFRITGSRSQAQELLKIIKGQYLNKLTDEYVGGVRIDPHILPWYPDGMAWQLDFTRKEIRENDTLKSLHGFLVSETESGNISRQEAVSMLPPLLMDIQPHHKILDMCAAPGSKTAQLIEMLHSNDEIPEPEGFVVANDMDNKRCYLMTHQVKRIQSPNCMIINHDARILPNMVLSKESEGQFVKYDRVLCDVPCSGDGTMRKNPDIWSKWHVNGAYNLHRIQKKVLQRGLELLAVGGKLVYSTCSLNPVEDEAVILTLIKQCDGAIELLDESDKLQGLNFCKGTYSWKIMGKDGSWYERVDQAPIHFQRNWDSTMYPPIITEAQDAKLERCIRVLPHQQNTGAFFIAVLQKTKELPWISARSHKAAPIINPKLKLDPSERFDGEHFSYSVKSNTGLYMYARCNLCNTMLQSRADHDSHKNGRKHRENHKNYEANKSIIAKEMESANAKVPDTGDKIDCLDDVETNVAKSAEQMEKDKDKLCENMQEPADKISENNTEPVLDEKQVKDKCVDDNEEREPPAKKPKTEESGIQNGVTEIPTDQNPSTSAEQESTSQSDEVKMAEADPSVHTEGEIKVVMRGHKEDPFYFCSKDDPVWPKIQSFYDVVEGFSVEQLMYRNMKRVLYYVSKPVRNLVLCNDERVKFINLGVKCFTNAPSPLVPDCDYRLSQEGMLAVHSKVKGRRIQLSKDDIVTILSQENPFIFKFSDKAQEDMHLLSPGSAVFTFTPTESDPEPNVTVIFCGWRGKTSVRSFVSRDERSHYLRLCGVELKDIQTKVQDAKLSVDDVTTDETRTGTPVGVPSGDEEEVKQWTEGHEDPRGTEVDELEGTDDKNNSDNEVQQRENDLNKEVQEGEGDKTESEKEVQEGEGDKNESEKEVQQGEGDKIESEKEVQQGEGDKNESEKEVLQGESDKNESEKEVLQGESDKGEEEQQKEMETDDLNNEGT